MKDIKKSFQKLVDDTFINIDGILVQKGVNANGNNGYVWHGEWYETPDEIRNAMKGIYTTISLSIVNPNGEEKKLGKEYTDLYFKGGSGYDAYRKDQ